MMKPDTEAYCKGAIHMARNPDVYLLYEYSKKNAFTVRYKVTLSDAVDEELLTQAAREAITRFPYFSVIVGLDEGENFVLLPNDSPLPVLPEKDERLMLGSEEIGGHLFALTWRDDTIWFNWAHCCCGAFGALPWIKTTLYQYLAKKYGKIEPPADLKAVGTPVDDAEYAYADPDSLPAKDPAQRYEGGDSNVGIEQDYLYFLNPFAKNVYYYQLEFDSNIFMDYARRIGGSPNSVLAALMLKTTVHYFSERKDQHVPENMVFERKNQHISAKIAADYRKDIGCNESYRDFVRFIHVKYEWEMEKEPIEKLSQMARKAINQQRQPENTFEWYRTLVDAQRGIDSQPDLRSKIKYARKHSIYRSDSRDTYMVSYVGQTEWGGMAKYIRSAFTITDGNLMLEVNALPDKFCVTFQLLSRGRKPLDRFCEVLREEGLSFTVSDRMIRYMPDLVLPKPEKPKNV